MRSIIRLCLLALIVSTPAMAQDTYVQGYHRNDGTYVQPHYRSQADGSLDNNFSTRGNTNPYTGSLGNQRLPSLNPGQDGYNHQPSTRNWNNSRPQGSSYKKPPSGM